jgi:hypothetical protein
MRKIPKLVDQYELKMGDWYYFLLAKESTDVRKRWNFHSDTAARISILE